jgi:hypothetical protein
MVTLTRQLTKKHHRGSRISVRHDRRRGDSKGLVIVACAFNGLPQGWYQAYALAAAAELAIVAALPDAKDLLAAATPAAEENAWAAACLAGATGRLHADPNAFTVIQAWHQIDAQCELSYTQRLLDALG